ncbi:hypothetical protein E5345_05185 [Propionibacterium sp. NM47_B9-13]|nr:hypothetical protein E5345_05185 [Propionibacterium sp. NM47_B9-13]
MPFTRHAVLRVPDKGQTFPFPWTPVLGIWVGRLCWPRWVRVFEDFGLFGWCKLGVTVGVGWGARRFRGTGHCRR